MRNIIITFIIGTVVFLIGTFYFNDFNYNSANHLIINFVFYQLYAFVLGYSNMLFFDALEKHKWGALNPLFRIVIGVIGSVVITLIGLFLLRALTYVFINGRTFSEFLQNDKIESYKFGLWITLTIVVIFHLVYFINRYQQKKIKEQKVIAGTASAKFDALKNQLDPHFLFNSLNVLNSLIEENPESAQEFTTALSKVYRYVLEQKNKDLVSLEEEFRFAKTYMSLLKKRFEDSLIFEIPEKVNNPESKVVPLSLQLLLENAVKHNVVKSSKPLHIKIIETDNYLIVENNLQSKQILNKSSGVGLGNIKQRYQLLTNKEVIIESTKEVFSVSLPILTKQVTVMESTKQTTNEEAYYRAKKQVDEIKGFYSNVISYILIIPFLIFINYRTSWEFKWFLFPMVGWGIGIGFHAFAVFGYGKSWEEKKINEILEREKNNSTKTWK